MAQIWQLPSRKFQCSLVGHSNWVRSAVFSPDSSLALSGGDDKSVKMWDVATHQCLHSFYDHTE
jgi:centriolar protein POC1